MAEQEQQSIPIVTNPPPDMQFHLTPKGEAELAAREEEERRGERQEAEQQRRDAATKARLEAVEQAGRQARALLGSIGERDLLDLYCELTLEGARLAMQQLEVKPDFVNAQHFLRQYMADTRAAHKAVGPKDILTTMKEFS